MSEWLIPKIEDVELSEDKKQLYIWFESDDFGNRYVSLEGKVLEHAIKLLLEIKSIKQHGQTKDIRRRNELQETRPEH